MTIAFRRTSEYNMTDSIAKTILQTDTTEFLETCAHMCFHVGKVQGLVLGYARTR